MVRVGEFSPQNPNLQTTGKSLLSIGEYEERRRQLLQRKREEYHQEMAQKLQNNMVNQNASPVKSQKVTRDCCTQTDLSLLTPDQHFSVDAQSSNAVQARPNALFDLQTTTGTHLLPLPEVPGLSTLTPRSQSPTSPGRGVSEVRLRQLRHQEDLRRQIEEKQRIEAKRKEQEAMEDEALARRVAEQQARLQAEFEEEERLRRQKEREKQFQTEEFLRRQEQLILESEQLKLEQRRKRMEALTALDDPQLSSAPLLGIQNGTEPKVEGNALSLQGQLAQEHTGEKKEKMTPCRDRTGKNAHSVPMTPVSPISILKSTSPPPRSPRAALTARADEQLEPPSPRALLKVLEAPNLRRSPKKETVLEDSLPIPLLLQARSPSPCRRSKSSQRSPAACSTRSKHTLQKSEAMQRLEDKWKVPAVQKNVMTKRKAGQWGDSSESHVVLTQLGSFRRQLQEEHMRMEEKIRDCQRQPRAEERHPLS